LVNPIGVNPIGVNPIGVNPVRTPGANGLSPAGTVLEVPAMSDTTTMPPLAVAFGADHAGVALKDTLADALRAEGFAVHDRGTIDTNFDGAQHAPRAAKRVKVGSAAA
jgi:hypothetical protein